MFLPRDYLSPLHNPTAQLGNVGFSIAGLLRPSILVVSNVVTIANTKRLLRSQKISTDSSQNESILEYRMANRKKTATAYGPLKKDFHP